MEVLLVVRRRRKVRCFAALLRVWTSEASSKNAAELCSAEPLLVRNCKHKTAHMRRFAFSKKQNYSTFALTSTVVPVVEVSVGVGVAPEPMYHHTPAAMSTRTIRPTIICIA